jgi:NAD(P)-dependent dehydrogenase (short-subunit alcohol dehydrogenase family)
MSDALRKEVGPLGIKVIVVEPGSFRTDFAGRSLHQAVAAIGDYAGTAGLRRKENDRTHGTQPGDPARAAQVLIDFVNAEMSPFRLLLGSDAVDVVRSELTDHLAEIDARETFSISTDFAR